MKWCKTFSLLLLIFAAPFSGSAQGGGCCPYIDSIYISPAFPTETDSVYFHYNIALPSNGFQLSQSVFIHAGGAQVEECYFTGMLPVIQYIIDSVNLGTFSSGVYQVDYLARQSVAMDSCDVVNQNGRSVTFSVSPTSLSPKHSPELLKRENRVFMNEQFIEWLNNFDKPIFLRIYSVNGQQVFNGSSREITTFSNWSNGFYHVHLSPSSTSIETRISLLINR
jgi:hypothetical protein